MAENNNGNDDTANSIKDPKQYEALRNEGMSKEKAARIANTPRKKAGRKGGKHSQYEEWTLNELKRKPSRSTSVSAPI